MDEIARHRDPTSRIWVTYDEYVYDITEFVEAHPGGEKILLAAGGAIEPFWGMYTIHNSENVKEILEAMKIGKLSKKDKQVHRKALRNSDPFADEPERISGFIVNSVKPFDVESPPAILADHFYTPNDYFFIRNHLPVPSLDPKTYNLEIMLPSGGSKKFTLEDLKSKFEHHSLTITLMCAGNRRGQMGEYKKIFGATAGHTAISNAEWTGVWLRDVLHYCGLNDDDPGVGHVQFEGWDADMAGDSYGASIPIEKAMNNHGDVLLAFEMNGETLSRDHGFPIRVVVPGVVGARSVKWLKRIIASPEESESHWQKLDYKSSPPSVEFDSFNFLEAPPIYESPVQSAICIPKDGATLNLEDIGDELNIKGYAYSGGGNGIIRVDVSVDGGKTWMTATLTKANQKPYRVWSWVLWEVDVPLPDERPSKLEILCKAVDSSHNVQPESIASIWNVRGFLNNSWHRSKIEFSNQQEDN